jgi:hypothetical protein
MQQQPRQLAGKHEALSKAARAAPIGAERKVAN